MVIINLTPHRITKLSCAVLITILLHSLLFWWVTNKNSDYQFNDIMPPPAVMVAFSVDTEAKKEIESNLGQEQQLSAASQTLETATPETELPALVENVKAEIQVVKAKKQPPAKEPNKKKPVEKQDIKQEQPSDQSQASSAMASSNAAAPNTTQRIAASYDSDSNAILNAEKQWQALVLGRLMKFKQYPDDASRRNRTGTPVVHFVVDDQGYVISSSLYNASGTSSLDREAQRVLKRAEPLPAPPSEILRNGQITVRLPIDFSLAN